MHFRDFPIEKLYTEELRLSFIEYVQISES
jgi:hypothetical protein